MSAKTDREINIIRGKALVGHTTTDDVFTLIEHIDAIEVLLEEADEDNIFGTEGWRHRLGIGE